ncbi:MAG: DNA-binding response regulator [Bacteroidetes bacterium]|nr:DNA-binding response regulator [Bacteroidota bacterium]
MEKAISIYMADDHQIVLDGLKLLIESEPNLIIVGSSNDGESAYSDILAFKPDIALIDMRMPIRNGIQIIISLRHQVSTKFIILSMIDEKRFINDAKINGAYGYLLKNTGKEELLRCINKVIHGETYFSLLETPKRDEKKSLLGRREMDVLRLIVSEYTTAEIAKELCLSTFTVETHRKNIYRKTEAKNLISLVKYAMENDLT